MNFIRYLASHYDAWAEADLLKIWRSSYFPPFTLNQTSHTPTHTHITHNTLQWLVFSTAGGWAGFMLMLSMIINPSPPSAEDSRKSFDVGSMTSIRRKSTRIICHRIWIANETWHHYKDWGRIIHWNSKMIARNPSAWAFLSFSMVGKLSGEKSMKGTCSTSCLIPFTASLVTSLFTAPCFGNEKRAALWGRLVMLINDFSHQHISYGTGDVKNETSEDAWEAYGKQRTGLAGKVRQSFQYFPR